MIEKSSCQAHTCGREAAGKKLCLKVEYQIIMMSFSLLVLRTIICLLSVSSSRDASQKSAEEANIIIHLIKMYKGPSLTLAVRELAH